MMRSISTACLILLLSLFTGASPADCSPITLNSALTSLPATFPKHPPTVVNYKFTCDYYQFQANGDFSSKERVFANYHLESPSATATWSNVTIAQAATFDQTFGSGTPQDYMDGFSYKTDDVDGSFKPGFFAGFPDKMETKSLIWDAGQIQIFGMSFLSKLKLDIAYHPTIPDSHFPGGGFFHNKQVEITWIGVSKVNGNLCAQILYEAPFNPITFVTSGITLTGMSNYHGLISVNLSDGQIENGTIEEDVLGTVVPIAAPSNFTPIIAHTIRHCVFQRI